MDGGSWRKDKRRIFWVFVRGLINSVVFVRMFGVCGEEQGEIRSSGEEQGESRSSGEEQGEVG